MTMTKQGFTLLECVFVLLLIAILGGAVTSHYVDLGERAEAKLAAAVVDEAQVRINTRFMHRLNAGDSCRTALETVDTLAKLADRPDTLGFGNFRLQTAQPGGALTEAGVSVAAESLASGRRFARVGELRLPSCERLLLSPDGGLEGDGGFENGNNEGMINPDGTCNPSAYPCGISRVFYEFLKERSLNFWERLYKILMELAGTHTIHSMDKRLLMSAFIQELEKEFEAYLADTVYAGFPFSEKLWAIDLNPSSSGSDLKTEFRVVISDMNEADAMAAYKAGESVDCELYGTYGNAIRYETGTLGVRRWFSVYPIIETDKIP